MRNQVAVLYAPHDLRVEHRPVPEPGPREVLIQIQSVGVCGSDVHYYEHGRVGSHIVREPMVLGHESSGIVVDLGPEASKHTLGERVALEPGIPCGRCMECRSGHYNLCQDVRFFATPPIDGTFANYVTIHEDFAFALPDNLSDDAGALIEPLSVGMWACRKAHLQGGEHVLITGAGPIGLLAMQAARALGAGDITISDINTSRLELAKQTGATHTLNVAEETLAESGIEADVLIECSGHPTAIMDGIRALRPAGTAVLVGMGPEENGTVPLAHIQNREILVTGVFRYANTYPGAIALAAAGRVDLDAIVTGHYMLHDAERALQAGKNEPQSVKAIVRPQASADER